MNTPTARIARVPTTLQITAAVVAAARLTGDDPVAVLELDTGFHARHLAFAALREAFPRAIGRNIAAQLNYSNAERAHDLLAGAQQSTWWREDWVDDVVGAIVGDRYGARAL